MKLNRRKDAKETYGSETGCEMTNDVVIEVLRFEKLGFEPIVAKSREFDFN